MAVLLALAACTGPPPAADTLFQDARALAVTPDGTLWVVDADAVLALRDGRIVQRIGGVGTGDDAFLDPVDVDPTNGQTIYVADRAAGAILQFTAEGRLVRSIPVPDVDPADVVRQRPSSRLGQPVAVAAGTGGALYIAEAGRGHVLELDAEGAVVRVLGPGLIEEPVDLAVDDDGTLWVADAGFPKLKAFDPFGSPGAVVQLGAEVGRLTSVSITPTGYVVAGDAVVTYCLDMEPGRISVHEVRQRVLGAVVVGGRLIGLTPTDLADLGPFDVD